MLDPDETPIRIQLLRQDHRDGGVGALDHLDLRHDQCGLAGMMDADEGVGRDLAGVIVGRLLRLVRGVERQADREHEAAGQSASHKRPARRPWVEIESAWCECAMGKFMAASYAWPSAARLIASRMRT